MKKLVLSLALAMTMILVSTIESKAIGFSIEYKLGQYCKGSGEVCIIKLELLKAPSNINEGLKYLIPFKCLNKDFTKEGKMTNTVGLSFSQKISGNSYYMNIEPIDANLISNNTYMFTITYTSQPKYVIVN